MPYEMYRPIVAIDVAAENATLEPREGSAKIKDNVAASQIARIGDRNRLSTLWKNPGIPLSREKANIIREFDVIEKRPQCQTHTLMALVILYDMVKLGGNDDARLGEKR